jgi:hypothetical protein
MKIRIPEVVGRAWDAWEDWANVPVWRFVRRIDIILAIGFVFCVGWYGYTTGWQGAAMGGILYLAIAAMALWVL